MKKDNLIFNQTNIVLPKDYVTILKEENILNDAEKFGINFFKNVGLNIIETDENYQISGNVTIYVYNLQKVLTDDLIKLSKLFNYFHGTMEVGYWKDENKASHINLNNILSYSICA